MITDLNLVITGRNIDHVVGGTFQVPSPVELPLPDGLDFVTLIIDSYVDGIPGSVDEDNDSILLNGGQGGCQEGHATGCHQGDNGYQKNRQ